MRQTHLLWDEEWVGFSWRNYTYEHMQRVRGLSRTMGRAEGAEPRVIEFAATLHDVTKSYDGEIVVGPDGKRVLDENGFWKNATLLPQRQNRVTDALRPSRARRDAAQRLRRAGSPTPCWRRPATPATSGPRVDQAIQEHLMAGSGASLEGKVLYDADTIDANIGLPAFYRNIQISLRGQDRQYARRSESFVEWLQENLPEYLDELPQGAHPHLDRGQAAGLRAQDDHRRRAGRRRGPPRAPGARSTGSWSAELEELEQAVEEGRLAVVRYFMENRSNPAADGAAGPAGAALVGRRLSAHGGGAAARPARRGGRRGVACSPARHGGR